ncbi:hypothetical protein AAE478_010049 [Parahypoxylon ruwenzoriense]
MAPRTSSTTLLLAIVMGVCCGGSEVAAAPSVAVEFGDRMHIVTASRVQVGKQKNYEVRRSHDGFLVPGVLPLVTAWYYQGLQSPAENSAVNRLQDARLLPSRPRSTRSQ